LAFQADKNSRKQTQIKIKEIKGKRLSFPFIYFSESGLFNGLQPIQIKKLLVLFRLRDVLSARLAQTSFPILFRPPPPLKSDRQKHITHASVFA
jgi:hypothetical protein